MTNYYLSFDCETTGLTKNCNVLTIYFIILDNQLNKIDDLNLNIKHEYYTIFIKALEINKINLLEHDKNAISITEAKKLLLNFLNKYIKDSNKFLIIGHNIKFDINMIINNNILNSNEINQYFQNDCYLDTYEIAKLLKSKNKINKCQSLSLSKLCYYFNIDIIDNNLHNCKYDTLYTIELFKKLVELKQS